MIELRRRIGNIYILGSFLLGLLGILHIVKPYVWAEDESYLIELARRELQIVRGASLWEEPLLEAPSPIAIYSGDFIRSFSFTNIRDFLEYLPSFYLLQDVNERAVSWRGIYTTSSNAFLFIENGLRLDLPSFGSFILDASYPMKDIKKIEIVYGPSSSIYGTNALSGIIQVERDISPTGGEILLGDNEEKGVTFSVGSNSTYGLIHYRDLPGDIRDGARVHPRRDNFGFIFKRAGADSLIQMFAFLNRYNTPRSQKGFPLSPEDTAIYGSHEKVTLLTGSWSKVISFGDTKIHFQPAFTVFSADTPQIRDTADMGLKALDIELKNYRLNLLLYGEKPLFEGRLLLGLEGSFIEHRRYSSKFFNGTETIYQSPRKREINLALFSQYKYFLTDRILLNVGLRYDYFELWKARLSPRLSLTYFIKPNFTAQLGYTEAFNAPPYFYATANPALGYGAITELKPEILRNYYLNFSFLKNSFYSRLTTYFNRLVDKIGYDSLQKAYVNLDKIDSLGIEFENSWSTDHFNVFLNYSLISVMSGRSSPIVYKNEYFQAIPKWAIKGGISFRIPHLSNLRIAPMFRMYGRSYYSNYTMAPYLIFDLNFGYKFKSINFSINIENLFDKKYYRAGTLPPVPWSGRNYKFILDFQF